MPTPAETTVVIPAAGRVPESVLSIASVASSAMIPVGGRPVVFWTMRYLRSLGFERFVVAVAEKDTFLEDFVRCTFGQEASVEFIVPSRSGGVGFTVKELLERVTTPASMVVLGDTHFAFDDTAVLNGPEPFVLTGPVENSRRWCVATTDDDGYVQTLQDKVPGLEQPLSALIGVYGFPDTQAALESATQVDTGGRVEMSDILRKVGERTPVRAIVAGDWMDAGNADRLAGSNRSMLQKREFNELEIDPILGTITKRSKLVDKFIDEINYLRLLPPDLQVLFPRQLDFSTDWSAPWSQMEYYGYPTLAQVFLFEHVDPAIWEQVFRHLFAIITEAFARYRRPLPEGALEEMYLTKTHNRLQYTKGSCEIERLIRIEGDITINGEAFANFPKVWMEIIDEVHRWTEGASATVIHGDLCLSNILYDLRSRVVKLIDPRGSFGDKGIFGDPLYDVAKLYHSIYGLYDFIVADTFEVAVDGDQIKLDIHKRPHHDAVLERFERVFFPTFDRRAVLLRTSMLFASMPALHYDAPRRQIAMYARALQLAHEALGEDNT